MNLENRSRNLRTALAVCVAAALVIALTLVVINAVRVFSIHHDNLAWWTEGAHAPTAQQEQFLDRLASSMELTELHLPHPDLMEEGWVAAGALGRQCVVAVYTDALGLQERVFALSVETRYGDLEVVESIWLPEELLAWELDIFRSHCAQDGPMPSLQQIVYQQDLPKTDA